jgi:thiol-disulfide isomerase/thioredoxin
MILRERLLAERDRFEAVIRNRDLKNKRKMGSLTMKMNSSGVMASIFCLAVLTMFASSPLFAAPPPEVPVKGMVTMVDLGAKKCIPCKMMAPILEKLEIGRAHV